MTPQNDSQIVLEDLCTLVVEQVKPENAEGAIYIGLEHISPGKIFSDSSGYAEDVQSLKYIFHKNDVLYGKLRPYLDKAVMAKANGICTTELLVLRPKEGVFPLFLACMLHNKDFVDYAMGGVTGVQHPRTSWAHIKNYEIGEFSPEIGRKIGILMAAVQQASLNNEKLLKLTNELKHATMHKLFTYGLRGEPQKQTEIGLVPESWELTAIDEIAVKTQYGLSIRGNSDGRYPILRMNCQVDGKVEFRDLQYVDVDDDTFLSFKLNYGDILFNRTNSIEHVGRTALYTHHHDAVFASYLIRLTVDAGKCLPEFINHYMNWPTTQREIKKLASRAVGQANINATKLRTVKVSLPQTLDEQQEIVAILDAIDQKIDLHRRKKTVLEELFKSLLHKLMTGEVRADDLDLSALEDTQPQAQGGAA